MVVYFGRALMLFNPFVTLRSICGEFNFHPCKNYTLTFLASITKTFNNVRCLQTSQSNFRNSTPDVVYIPDVVRWLKNKIKFKRLKRTWDPEFTEGAFIYGTSQALCKVSDIIHDDQPEELVGLLTDEARIKLVSDMTTRLTPMQKKIIKIQPDNIKILVPIYINLEKQGPLKTCEISLKSLALKWFNDNGNLNLVLVALQTEFTRDYSEGVKPEWTISIYDILECAILRETPIL